jgi:hypothetical protein
MRQATDHAKRVQFSLSANERYLANMRPEAEQPVQIARISRDEPELALPTTRHEACTSASGPRVQAEQAA